jgi:hypothetical protein
MLLVAGAVTTEGPTNSLAAASVAISLVLSILCDTPATYVWP